MLLDASSQGYGSPSKNTTTIFTTAARLGSPFQGTLSSNTTSNYDGTPSHLNNHHHIPVLSPFLVEASIRESGLRDYGDSTVAREFDQAEKSLVGETASRSSTVSDNGIVNHLDDNDTDEAGSPSLIDLYLRSITPDLADKDPFQAAMGLVYLSKLGLEWDYS